MEESRGKSNTLTQRTMRINRDIELVPLELTSTCGRKKTKPIVKIKNAYAVDMMEWLGPKAHIHALYAEYITTSCKKAHTRPDPLRFNLPV